MNTCEKIDTYRIVPKEMYVNTNTYEFLETYQNKYTRPKIASMTHFGENLREARKKAGLTQDQMADKVGMIRTNYVKIETKGEAGDRLLQRIASVEELGLDLETLRAWKAMDQYNEPETIKVLFKNLPKEEIMAALDELPPDILEAVLQKRLGPGKLKRKSDV
jgi:transcriptional regulator with XRE-family HTH domain